MKAALYLRVSTSAQDERNQEPECRRLAVARGWEPVTFTEQESGARPDRTGWGLVLELARRGEIGAVVVWSLDRLGRRMFDVVRDVEELGRLNVAVVSVKEPWLDTGGPTRGLLLSIFAWVAQHEHERLRERTRLGLARAREQGKRIGRPSQLTPEALARARELRSQTPPPSWKGIAQVLELEGLGKFTKGALSRSVPRTT